jgi:hypothetical protein
VALGPLLNASGVPLPNREILRHYFVAILREQLHAWHDWRRRHQDLLRRP